MKVLLVSPDPHSREVMRIAVGSAERLLDEPFDYVEARDGVQGLRAAWREAPDVVVAEESASRMGAFALARDLRGAAEPFLGGIVILLDRAQDAWLAKWSGADAWFTKPIDPFALADTVASLIRERADERVPEPAEGTA
jgi:DNA-binding response OmpR family regulator